MKKQFQILVLIFLVVCLISLNYNSIDSFLIKNFDNQKSVFVERVIDGDTIVTNSEEHIRLLGINCPETTKKEKYSKEAKEFLENLILNKKIVIKENGKDKYHRTLAYVFFKNKNVNLELVENGLANFYFPSGKDIYYNNFKNAWENCIVSNKNLCEKSQDKCANCIELKKFDYENQEIIFYNKCGFDCNLTRWGIKDEGRKHFVFDNFVLEKGKQVLIKVGSGINTKEKLFWEGEKYVWTFSGDTLFLRDSEGKLVIWESY